MLEGEFAGECLADQICFANAPASIHANEFGIFAHVSSFQHFDFPFLPTIICPPKTAVKEKILISRLIIIVKNRFHFLDFLS